MYYKISHIIPAVALLFAIPACNKTEQDKEVADAAPEEESKAPTNRIDIPYTVRQNLGITFAKVERRVVGKTVRVPGAFELHPLAIQEYRMTLPGHIDILVNQFDVVKKGTPLFRVKSLKYLELQQNVALARATLKQSQTKLQTAQSRKKTLASANIKRADLEDLVSNLLADVNQSEAELKSALIASQKVSQFLSSENTRSKDSGLSGEWIEVVAQTDGVVEAFSATNGTYAEETDLVLTTIDPKMVRFRAVGLQSDALNWTNGLPVKIVPPQSETSNLNDSSEAKLQISMTANPSHRTIDLIATPLALKPWIRPGMTGFLEITENPMDGVVLAIPRSAVVKDGINHVFFKRDPLDSNKAIRIEADLGVNDGRWIEIMSDIGPKDEVVLNGAYELKLASSQSGISQKGGHFHADGTYHGEDH